VPEAFADRGDKREQALADRSRVAGEVDDQGFSTSSRQSAREDRRGDFGEADSPHGLSKARKLAIKDLASGFGSHVSRGRTSAAGCHDQFASRDIGQLDERGPDLVRFVRQKADEKIGMGIQGLSKNDLDLGAAQILIDPRTGPIAECDASDFHFLVFSMTRISEIIMVLSTALHMS
jgi:hypothetical protein